MKHINTTAVMFRSLPWMGGMVISAMLVGCTTPTPPTPSSRTTTGAPVGSICTAAPAQTLVGKPGTAKVVEEARVLSGARMARVLRPGQAVTMEFNADRLNLEVNAAGAVTAARCG